MDGRMFISGNTLEIIQQTAMIIGIFLGGFLLGWVSRGSY